MNIAVYCGSASGTSPLYASFARELGAWIARRGHTLVYGGSNIGLMGEVANAVLAGGGEVIGVLPKAARIQSVRHPNLTRYVETDTVSERKATMIELADAYIALPGGPGTLDEIAEVIALSKIGLEKESCILVNIGGYYDPLRALYETMVSEGFTTPRELSRVLFSSDLDDIAAFVESMAR